MRALRIFLTQASANYRKEETMLNKMTFPLPPVSTVIGAIHTACGYRELRPMDVSIQGRYGAMHREPYTDYCFLNSTMDDRGILVKMKNPDLFCKAYDKVASEKSRGCSFLDETAIQVHNRELLNEYQQLKKIEEDIKRFKSEKKKEIIALVNKRKSTIRKKIKLCVKDSEKFVRLEKRQKELKEFEENFKQGIKNYEEENYTKPISQFRSLTTSMKFYEVLDEVELLLHIRAEDSVLEDILNHVFELKSIGRSEDFVNVIDAQIVELTQDVEEFDNPYAAYIHLDEIRNDRIYTKLSDDLSVVTGTKYYLNKYYDTEAAKTGKRVFSQRVPVIYTSEHSLAGISDNLYVDEFDGKKYVVNFL